MLKNLSEKPIAELQMEQADQWEKEDLLHKCVTTREGKPSFIFYEGPPTANGRPGIHHVISRTLKDSICRYKTMQGFQVERKGGWDTHGLPVEIEVEKQLGLSQKRDIEAYGIEAFNKKCRESVFTYEGMWREMTKRMGFLIDMDNPYVTLKNDYIESVWWILSEFFKKDFIYEGHKVLPYCPRCGTGLASHEVAQGYKEVKVNTVTSKFKRKGEEEYFLAWTTTPWTQPSNVSLTVGPELEYIKGKMKDGSEKDTVVYVAKVLADRVLGEGKYDILEEMKGKDLEYMEYEQLMPFVKVDKKAFYITCNDYVTTEDGTGIVHTAPAFGEDDYRTGKKYDLPIPKPVDEQGNFTETPWAGRFVMEPELEIDIIKWMAAENKIFSKEKVVHNYPHCWRCGTPLIYYARPGWYIAMSKLKDELVANNNAVNWFPDFVGEKRFGNWLENVNDWAISRSRYWGTPLPVWRCACGHMDCVGSRAELVERAREEIDETIELHRPYVDEVHLTCPHCGGIMSRTPEVIDCWFDSGAMPFAQQHYPFENAENFDQELFPADYVCEGIDQTRGWFYSLMAISTFIRGRAPYKNVLVNDLVLDKDGKKMSKSKNNTVDPFELFGQYGADATRWYLLCVSPVWAPTRFDEDGLKDVVNKFFGTLRNVYHFFVLYANQDKIDPSSLEVVGECRPELDRWILSKYNKLIKEVTEEMDRYDHNKSVRKIQEFVSEDLSNWYIRRARRRFWGETLDKDKQSVYGTTYEILIGVARLIAPFAPFISDEIYRNLTGAESVHIADFPKTDEDLIDSKVEERMDLVRDLVSLGRGIREKESIKVRQPLTGILVDGKYENLISDLVPLIMEELNVKEVIFEKDPDKYMAYSLKPNFKTAGPVLGKDIKAFGAALAAANPADFVAELERKDHICLNLESKAPISSESESASSLSSDAGCRSVEVTREMVDVKINAREGFAVAMENNIFVILDTTITDRLADEGLARELISKVQQLRKQKDFQMMDRIHIFVKAGEEVSAAIQKHKTYIMKETLAEEIREQKHMKETPAEEIKENAEKSGVTKLDEAKSAAAKFQEQLTEYDLNGFKTGIDVERI